MLRAFAGAGYDVHWHLLDSRRWVAQKRLRLYIIGFRRDLHVSGFVPPCEFGPLTLGGALATKPNDETHDEIQSIPMKRLGRRGTKAADFGIRVRCASQPVVYEVAPHVIGRRRARARR